MSFERKSPILMRHAAGGNCAGACCSMTIKAFGGMFVFSLAATVIFWMTGLTSLIGVGILACIISLAALASWSPLFSSAAFSLWMTASVAAPIFYPELFLVWYGFELKRTVNPFIMFIMFGMGTSLSLGDFKRVLLMPRVVIIGVSLQYTIMPLVGKLVAMSLASGNTDVAAGVILLGNVPAAATSNVMNYLAGSNVPLSVTMTALTTIVSPLVTPGLTQLLGGVYVRVDFLAMMISIMTIVVVPVALGVVVNKILTSIGKMHASLAAVSSGVLRSLPRFVMFAMCAALAALTAAARGQLIYGTMVTAIVLSVIVHTVLGLCLGYWASRLFRLDEKSCRTIAFVVGMQNSGVAAGLALDVLKKPLASIPGVVCSIWQNLAGALLASWWRKRPPNDELPNNKAAMAEKRRKGVHNEISA